MSSASRLLGLPLELRLQIYDHCLLSGSLTVSGCVIPPWWPTSVNQGPSSIPGLGRDHMPLAKVGFDRRLLEGHPDIKNFTWASKHPPSNTMECPNARHSETNQADIPTSSSVWMLPAPCSPSTESPSFLAAAIPSLRLTCRQINSELRKFRNLHSPRGSRAFRNLDLYLSYPYGVCVVAHRYPHLLELACVVYVTGMCGLVNVPNPFQQPNEVRRLGRRGTDGKPIIKRSMEEEQADAMLYLVERIHLLGHRAVDATERAMDASNENKLEKEEIAASDSSSEPETASTPSPTLSTSSTLRFDIEPPSTQIPTIDPPPSRSASETSDPNLPPIPTFHLRIFYPAAAPRIMTHNPAAAIYFQTEAATAETLDPYSLMWSHNLSPAAVTLAAINGGHIRIWISRNRRGTAIELTGTGNRGAGRLASYAGITGPEMGLRSEKEVLDWCIPPEWGAEQESEGTR